MQGSGGASASKTTEVSGKGVGGENRALLVCRGSQEILSCPQLNGPPMLRSLQPAQAERQLGSKAPKPTSAQNLAWNYRTEHLARQVASQSTVTTLPSCLWGCCSTKKPHRQCQESPHQVLCPHPGSNPGCIILTGTERQQLPAKGVTAPRLARWPGRGIVCLGLTLFPLEWAAHPSPLPSLMLRQLHQMTAL